MATEIDHHHLVTVRLQRGREFGEAAAELPRAARFVTVHHHHRRIRPSDRQVPARDLDTIAGGEPDIAGPLRPENARMDGRVEAAFGDGEDPRGDVTDRRVGEASEGGEREEREEPGAPAPQRKGERRKHARDANPPHPHSGATG
jgi:hypothetical protein